MSDRPVIRADFVKPMPVPSRKVLQLVFEVSEEAADHAMEVLGGYPQSGQNRWCAIAQLDPTAGVTTPTAEQTQERPEGTEQGQWVHRSWDELTPTQQAGIACKDPAFQQWICLKNGNEPREDTAASMVRGMCGVESRSELSLYPKAATAWGRLYVEFKRAQRGDTEAARLAQRDRT